MVHYQSDEDNPQVSLISLAGKSQSRGQSVSPELIHQSKDQPSSQEMGRAKEWVCPHKWKELLFSKVSAHQRNGPWRWNSTFTLPLSCSAASLGDAQVVPSRAHLEVMFACDFALSPLILLHRCNLFCCRISENSQESVIILGKCS